MKALTVHQPHATAIALDIKHCETRSWRTHYRGPIAIHAGLFSPVENMPLLRNAPADQQAAIVAAGYHVAGKPSLVKMPNGVIVATAILIDCVEVELLEERYPMLFTASRAEKHWGDYRAGRFGWILSHVHRLAKPIEIRGKQGLWNWNAPADFKFTS